MFSELFKKGFNNNQSQLKSYNGYSGSCLLSNDNVFAYTTNSREFIKYYFESCPVFTGIKLIQDNISTIKPVIRDNQKDEFIYEHPLLTLLENPNPFVDGRLFIKSLASFFTLTGNVYVNVIGSNRPVELSILAPQNMTILPDMRDGYPDRYQYSSTSSNIVYKRDQNNKFFSSVGNELGHLRTFNPRYCNNDLYGISDLVACELEISQYMLASIHNNSLLMNQARPSGILTYKGEVTDIPQETVDEIKETLRNNLSGAANAGGSTFLSGDFDWKQLSQSVKDMDFATLKKQTTEAIYNALKIPLPMVSPDNMTLANMEQAKLNFYDNTIIPLATTIFKYLGSLLLSRYPNSENLELTFDPASIEALEPRQIDNTLKLSNSGVLTINEIRSRLGYEDLEGGDTLYQQATLAPIASDTFTEDNREKPTQEKSIFTKIMRQSGYTDDIINQYY
jgi:HK97 family phage portal protein